LSHGGSFLSRKTCQIVGRRLEVTMVLILSITMLLMIKREADLILAISSSALSEDVRCERSVGVFINDPPFCRFLLSPLFRNTAPNLAGPRGTLVLTWLKPGRAYEPPGTTDAPRGRGIAPLFPAHHSRPKTPWCKPRGSAIRKHSPNRLIDKNLRWPRGQCRFCSCKNLQKPQTSTS
jgi:hypothetical protein